MGRMAAAEEWWTLEEAADRTKFNSETIRGWTKGERSVHSRLEGGRRVVLSSDVLLRAARTRPRRRRVTEAAPAAPLTGLTLDRLATLEEIVRRQRIIDEHREEIERRHLEIARQHREIVELALGPSVVPGS